MQLWTLVIICPGGRQTYTQSSQTKGISGNQVCIALHYNIAYSVSQFCVNTSLNACKTLITKILKEKLLYEIKIENSVLQYTIKLELKI